SRSPSTSRCPSKAPADRPAGQGISLLFRSDRVMNGARHEKEDPMPQPPACPPRSTILEVTFECDHCGNDTPARDGKRARMDGPLGRITVDLCQNCYEAGIED